MYRLRLLKSQPQGILNKKDATFTAEDVEAVED